ncbi:MAG: radical SAM protein [Bacteroidales bacterium]
MLSMRHFNIPVFIPGLACPYACVFCDQQKISGQHQIPSPQEVHQITAQHLQTLPERNRRIEIAFFGGSFTGLPMKLQQQYLAAAHHWVAAGKVDGIRLSTRPDFINPQVMELLKRYNVSCVELGAQSLDDGVLERSGRGHTATDVARAAEMIVKAGIALGLQMMTGLPGDTFEKTMTTAKGIAALKATSTRIYPTLVIGGTQLADLYQQGIYQPLTLEETISRCAWLLDYFESAGITVLRLGLHPSGDIHQQDLVAGPWHPALKELVLTRLWEQELKKLLVRDTGSGISIAVAPSQLNAAIGHKAHNRKMLERHFGKVIFTTDPNLQGRRIHADPC